MTDPRYTACPIHGTIHRIDMACVQCYMAGPQRPIAMSCESCAVLAQHVAAQREASNILEARIADLEAQLLSTNRQLAELQHQRIADMRAHNAIVPYVLNLAAQAGLLP